MTVKQITAKIDWFLLSVAILLAGLSQLMFFLRPRTWPYGLNEGFFLAMSAVALVVSMRKLLP